MKRLSKFSKLRVNIARTNKQAADDFSRPIRIDLCRDGTITYQPQGRPSFNGAALPVFSVNTEEQAKALQIRFGQLQYTSHPKMPGKPWFVFPQFGGQIEDLFQVREIFREWWQDGGDDVVEVVNLKGNPAVGDVAITVRAPGLAKTRKSK